MSNSLLQLLGLARRAGKLALGGEAAGEAVRGERAGLVLLASDLAPRTARDVSAAAEQSGAKAVTIRPTMDEIARALGKRSGVIAVTDQGFARKLLALSTEE
jgi:ribosomal protein L7Ae-like RNA K-turn-binding protein